MTWFSMYGVTHAKGSKSKSSPICATERRARIERTKGEVQPMRRTRRFFQTLALVE